MSVELPEIMALQEFDPKSYMVMIVDDSPFQRKKFVETLEKKGFLVVECSTGQECLDTFEEKTPNLILMDMTTPEMDGATTCRKIRERGIVISSDCLFKCKRRCRLQAECF